MAASTTGGKGVNQKSTETTTVTTTTNTNVIQNKGSDATAITQALLSALIPAGGVSNGFLSTADPTTLLPGPEIAQGTPTTPAAAAGGNSFTQQIVIGVAVAAVVAILLPKAR